MSSLLFLIQSALSVSGYVVLEGGGAPPEPVAIQVFCSGVSGPPVYTLGQFRAISAGYYERPPGSIEGNAFMACEVRASLSGYHTATVKTDPSSQMGVDVGPVLLRRITNVSGFTYSMTSALAPPEAAKNYDAAMKRLTERKQDEARALLESAVQVYPSYAVAWFELGAIYHRTGKSEDARKAYTRALGADEQFVKPNLQLAMMAAAERKWQEVIDRTSDVIRRNPIEFPQAHLYQAMGRYNLGQLPEAEKSVHLAIETDRYHRVPKSFHLLGTILAERNDVAGALENLRAYLKYAPNGPNRDSVQRQLAALQASSARKP